MNRETVPTDLGTEQNAEGTSPEESSSNGDQSQRIAELEAENQQLRDKALRSVADLENVRRRAETERQQTLEYANEQLLRQLLPVVDDFERSVESGGKTPDFEALFRGIQLIHSNLAKLFERIGVKRMATVGEPFDVHLHEAVMRQPSELPEDTVVIEVEPGYMYHDRVLRHAKVIISAGQ
ncbi:MAG: nucleotide exchange factor GrpE [bacterium]|nr:nucleotide exchange factor GrpE [Candidatus Kapabacteria bacterium]